MPILNWSEELAVDIPELDDQHKQLIALINRLHDAMSEGRGKKVISGVLEELISYTKTHFVFEEKLMTEAKYLGLASQQHEHKILTQQVLDFQKRYENGEIAITVEISNFLKDWIVNHVKKMDKAYSSALRKSMGLE